MIAVPAIAEIAVCRKTARIMFTNFPVYNRYESSQTENGKNHFRAEFGAVSPRVKFLLPFQCEPF